MPALRNEALVKPELLVWARESLGLSIEQAAKRISIKPNRLLACEQGQARLTVRQLRELSNVYKRTLAFFYLPAPPRPESDLHDFRRLPDEPAIKTTPELRLEIRKARHRRVLALELYQELEMAPPFFEASTIVSADVFQVAGQIRELLRITSEKQANLRGDYEAYNFWRDAIETSGVLVFQGSISLRQMRGFSIAEFPLPVITVNSKDSPLGRVFTLIHELTHIMLRSDGVCDLQNGAAIEVFCNAVAGETLVPTDLLVQEPLIKEHANLSEWPDESVRSLAILYSVSREVILRRLLTLGAISQAFYQKKRAQIIKEYSEIKSAGGPTQEVIAISRAGKTFARLVIDSYQQNKIDLIDASQYLGVRSKYLEKIEKALFGAGGKTGGED